MENQIQTSKKQQIKAFNDYGVTAPIIVDNAESVNDILPTDSQQIRLEVSQSELEVV